MFDHALLVEAHSKTELIELSNQLQKSLIVSKQVPSFSFCLFVRYFCVEKTNIPWYQCLDCEDLILFDIMR